MKKLISLALVLTLILAMIPATYAADLDTPVDDDVPLPITSVSGSLTFNGTTAVCSGSVSDLNKTIVATMTLSQGGTVVASWSGNGTSYVPLNGSCNVTKGLAYTLVISGTVDGTPFSTTPITKTC